MEFFLFYLLFLVVTARSTPKRELEKVAVSSNSSDVNSTNINCQNCRIVVSGSKGIITSVSNFSVHFCELVYGWTVEVPMHYDTHLTFNWPNKSDYHIGSSTCESCKPYLEIIYIYSTSELTYKIEKFYDFPQLANLNIPSHLTEIRFYSGVPCNESQKFETAGFTISFKAISFENKWSFYTLLSVFIPGVFIILGIAYFCVTMKRKEEPNQDVLSLPIPIYVDLDNSGGEIKKCKVEKKQNRGLRLRTHLSSRMEEPSEIMVVSSLADSEVFGSGTRPENLVTPDSSNLDPTALTQTKKHCFLKRLPPKVNLVNRFPRSALSTPRYSCFNNETSSDDRLSKSDVVIFEKKVDRRKGREVFNFDEMPSNEVTANSELEISVFLHPSSTSSGDGLPNDSNRDSSFVSPK